MNKHMHEKTNPPIKPLWKTVVLWQSIFSIFCGMAFITVSESLGNFKVIVLYPFISVIWSYIFMIVSVRKEQFLRGFIPLLFSVVSLFSWIYLFYQLYLFTTNFAP
jgi:hypothetical protein